MIANTFRKQARGLEEKDQRRIKETLSSQMLLRSGKKLNSANILRLCSLWLTRHEASSILIGQEAPHQCQDFQFHVARRHTASLIPPSLHGPSFVPRNWFRLTMDEADLPCCLPSGCDQLTAHAAAAGSPPAYRTEPLARPANLLGSELELLLTCVCVCDATQNICFEVIRYTFVEVYYRKAPD